ncbi:chemotaxis protein CheB [Nocardia colli]|uniref:protein-glutamate methylesterase n=2 Tax=Nocardia colli TaxID=2545717 RepID=A0A5N0E8E5_9NOCA|nr:chemotaxis protein CheB [Nocardia colli]
MTTNDQYAVVAIASSAGGITALFKVLGDLPAALPVPVLIVQHLDPRHKTVLAELLSRRTELQVKLAESGDVVQPGVVYIAPPNYHLLVEPRGILALSGSELVHFVRPSADLLFESVAGAYGSRAIACVLSGTGRDGASGVSAVKSRGGTVVVQDPDNAEFNGMPHAAVATGSADLVVPLDEIADVIRGLVIESAL